MRIIRLLMVNYNKRETNHWKVSSTGRNRGGARTVPMRETNEKVYNIDGKF